MTLQEKLTLLLDRRGFSQAELARRSGVPQPRLNLIINGKGRIFLDQAFALAKALEVRLDWLADESAEGEPNPVPSERELQVGEIVRQIGWEKAYWRLVIAQDDVLRPASPPYRGTDDPARHKDGRAGSGSG